MSDELIKFPSTTTGWMEEKRKCYKEGFLCDERICLDFLHCVSDDYVSCFYAPIICIIEFLEELNAWV